MIGNVEEKTSVLFPSLFFSFFSSFCLIEEHPEYNLH